MLMIVMQYILMEFMYHQMRNEMMAIPLMLEMDAQIQQLSKMIGAEKMTYCRKVYED